MDVVQAEAALRHPVSGHWAVDAAGEHVERAARGAHGQAALTGDLRAVDIRAVIPDFYNHFKIGVVDIHLEVIVLAQQVSAQLPHQLRAGHGEALVGAAGLHLKGADAVETVAQIILRRLADGVKIFLTDHGTAQGSQTKDGLDPVEREVHVDVLFLGLHVERGLSAVHPELAHGLEAVAQNFHHGRLKLVAVEAFQGHFALIAHNHFSHIISSFSVNASCRLQSG